jgi:NADH:ubiquinone oxidoreductase subunit 5 (subunit L)/multisubunit Na+/H+ antiporter MnhA subunit
MLCRTLLLLCADAVEAGAGTRRLDRLGGLVHRMRATAANCLVGLFAIALLPPGLGFAAFWLLFQSLLATARFGDAGLRLLSIGVAALLALSAGLSALAAVRLFGVVFLGRPRTPRTAVAEEAPRADRYVLCGLAGLIALLGVVPALALLPAAGWTNAVIATQALVLRTGVETPGYAAAAVAGLLAIAGIAVFRGLRRTGEQRREPTWSGGFAAPPAWLPFGDPATQYGPASFVEPLQRIVALWPSMQALQHRLNRWRDAVLRVATTLVAP